MNSTNLEKFRGVFPALLTPFDKQNKINEKALEKLVKYNLDKGVDGFYVCGSTGEAFMLSDDERKYVYDIVADTAKGKATLIAHIGTISTDKALEFGLHAKKLGYDAVSAVSPFYYKFSFDQIKKHYFTLAEGTGLPMIVYNIPVFSGVTLTVDQIGQFLGDDKFIGVKHTSNDYFALERFKSAFPDKIVYNGYDEMFLCGLSMGADGGIGSTYNFMAEKYIEMRRLFNEKKIEEAQALQKEANIIIEALCKVGVMEGEKAILDMLGFDFGDMRAPFSKLDDSQKDFIRKTILPLLK